MPLRVPALAFCNARSYIDLVETFATRGAGSIPVRTIWRDKRGDTDEASLREKRGDLARATNVLRAVVLGKPEISIEAVPQVVAIEDVHLVPEVEEATLELKGESGLARPGKACKPEHTAAVPVSFSILIGTDPMLDPNDVRCFHWPGRRVNPPLDSVRVIAGAGTLL